MTFLMGRTIVMQRMKVIMMKMMARGRKKEMKKEMHIRRIMAEV